MTPPSASTVYEYTTNTGRVSIDLRRVMAVWPRSEGGVEIRLVGSAERLVLNEDYEVFVTEWRAALRTPRP
jgi:hypothetical protein